MWKTNGRSRNWNGFDPPDAVEARFNLSTPSTSESTLARSFCTSDSPPQIVSPALAPQTKECKRHSTPRRKQTKKTAATRQPRELRRAKSTSRLKSLGCVHGDRYLERRAVESG